MFINVNLRLKTH